jgi:F-type H+-transporting ATPase subunit c
MLNMLALLQQAAPLSDTAAKNIGLIGAGIGFGLAILGLGIGMGRIGGAIADGIARQPEAAKEIASGPFIIAILLEGATIIALVFALLFKIL